MNKKDTSSEPVPFPHFEAAAKQILSVSKKAFDKVLKSRPRRPKKPHGTA